MILKAAKLKKSSKHIERLDLDRSFEASACCSKIERIKTSRKLVFSFSLSLLRHCWYWPSMTLDWVTWDKLAGRPIILSTSFFWEKQSLEKQSLITSPWWSRFGVVAGGSTSLGFQFLLACERFVLLTKTRSLLQRISLEALLSNTNCPNIVPLIIFVCSFRAY